MRTNPRQAGFTLVEMMVGAVIGAFLTLAAVGLAQRQTKLLGVTTNVLEVSQASRTSLSRIQEDLRMAGVGVGYDEAGNYVGLDRGTFTRGTASFTSNNKTITVSGVSMTTDDLGILTANGGFATIAAWSSGGTGQVCRDSGITAGDIVLLRSEEGVSARTVKFNTIANASSCTAGQCVGGCDDFTWTADATYVSGPDATNVSYAGGEATGGFQRITWFVDASDPARPGVGTLRRVAGTCAARDYTCGIVVADYVETLQTRVFARINGAWVDYTASTTPVPAGGRIRVDLELVMRSRSQEDATQLTIPLNLEASTCVPSCTTPDRYLRRAVRTSVEIKNSGRTLFGW